MSAAHEQEEVLRRRLSVQRLDDPGRSDAVDVVRLLTCVQSQEHAHAFWSIGMRCAGLSAADVRAEFDAGRFVRTHILRPTWHFVAAEDLRWILACTSARVQQLNRYRYRQLELDQSDLDRGCEVILAALADRSPLTRPELADALEAGGVPAPGQRLAYLVMNAELEALICSGPMRGAQHTYTAVAGRVPATPELTREHALAELTRRFFVGHGPASAKDLVRWSSMTTADVAAGLELVADRLERIVVDGQVLWADPDWEDRSRGPTRALLLPLYDEALLSYPQLNFPLAAAHPHPPGTDLFVGSIVYDTVNVGTWRRTVQGRKVRIEARLAPGVSVECRTAVGEARQELAGFLGLELVAEPVDPS
jgi:hypothetical protein